MSELATYELTENIAVLTIDDGKANAFGPSMIATVDRLLDQALAEAKAVVVTGRPGIFSGGFDLNVIRGGDPDAAQAMRVAGTRLMMRLYGLPLPLVVAASGHAIALGAFCLLTADYRVGADGEFRIGLNETAIGMSLPPFALMLAKERLSKRYLTRATMAATMFSPREAADAGFLDAVVSSDDLRERALEVGRSFLKLDVAAYVAVKRGLREESIARVVNELEA